MIQTEATCANVTLLSELTEYVTTKIQRIAGAGMRANVTVQVDCDVLTGLCSPDSGGFRLLLTGQSGCQFDLPGAFRLVRVGLGSHLAH
jgi:hypothetical protein